MKFEELPKVDLSIEAIAENLRIATLNAKRRADALQACMAYGSLQYQGPELTAKYQEARKEHLMFEQVSSSVRAMRQSQSAHPFKSDL